ARRGGWGVGGGGGRLLRPRQARRVVPLPRAGHRLGAARVPHEVLMCGIVGLYCKSAELEPRLGELLSAMLVQLSDRGPDSAGVAVYRDPAPDDWTKLTLYASDPSFDWSSVGGVLVAVRCRHAVAFLVGVDAA